MSPHPTAYKARTLSAIMLIVTGYFGYSVADLCAKLLQTHYTIYQVLGMSGFSGLAITGTWILARYGLKAFVPKNLPLHLLRAMFVLGTAYFMVSSLKLLPLADFYGIAFVMPFLTMMLAVVFLNEKVGWRRWCAAAVGFSGVLVLAGPQFDHIGLGVAYALLGALCAACNVIALRKIGSQEPLPLYGFYPFLLITLFHLGGLVITGTAQPIHAEDWPFIAIHGPVTVLGIVCISLGFARAPETAVVAPFLYTQIIWGVIFGVIFFGVFPTQTTFAGLALIIGAGLYSLWREYARHHHIE